MVIFHSYVSLPEGNYYYSFPSFRLLFLLLLLRLRWRRFLRWRWRLWRRRFRRRRRHGRNGRGVGGGGRWRPCAPETWWSLPGGAEITGFNVVQRVRFNECNEPSCGMYTWLFHTYIYIYICMCVKMMCTIVCLAYILPIDTYIITYPYQYNIYIYYIRIV